MSVIYTCGNKILFIYSKLYKYKQIIIERYEVSIIENDLSYPAYTV